MTRAEIRRNVLLRLAEAPEQGREPLYLDESVRMAADEVARRTDCYQTYYTMDINGSPTPSTRFCLPDELYKIKSAKVINEDDTVRILTHRYRQFVSRVWMDKFYFGWQNTPAETGAVRYIVLERPYAFLYPFPAYDKTGGLTLYGYATPGDWSADDDECPLPGYAHHAVELRAALMRCTQFPTKENQMRYPMIEREYNRAIGLVARDAMQEAADASPFAGGSI